MIRRAFLVLGCVLSTLGIAAEVEEAHVAARIAKSSSGGSGLFVYSKTPLKEFRFWSKDKTWKVLPPMPQQDGTEFENVSVYRIPIAADLKDGTRLLVVGYSPEVGRFQDALFLEPADADGNRAVSVKNVSFEDKETVQALIATAKAAALAARNAWENTREGQFMTLLNNYRMQNGLRPVSWCPRCASVAAQNNYAGGGHRVTGGMRQNWAMGAGVQGTFNMWRHSSGHDANMRASNVSYAGIHFHGNQATLNLR